MLKKDLWKHSPIEVDKEVKLLEELPITNVLIKGYLKINYEAILTCLDQNDEFAANGIINYKILALDARDGTTFEYEQKMDWNETYLFSDFLVEEIDLTQLVVEQINANIPINLSHNHGTINKVGPGWQLLSEEEFETNRRQMNDPRWAKLKEFTEKNK